jgi:hypothetical protein
MQANRLARENNGWPDASFWYGPNDLSWPIWARVLASLALISHICAVLAGCLAAPPCSQLEATVFALFRPYCDFIYQGVAYRYYARLDMTVDPAHPRPWGTPIIFAEMDFESLQGTPRRTALRLPDADPRWPRLRHQRRIDLAYHLAADPRWAAAYARHLCKSYGCDRVVLYAQTHTIPDLTRLHAVSGLVDTSSLDPNDGSTYGARIKLGEFECTDFSRD